MIPAQCNGCGETVLSLAADCIKLSPNAVCRGCGKPVRKRGGWTELGAVLIFFVLIIFAANAVDASYERGLIYLGTIVFAFYMEWWSWRTVTWDPTDGVSPSE